MGPNSIVRVYGPSGIGVVLILPLRKFYIFGPAGFRVGGGFCGLRGLRILRCSGTLTPYSFLWVSRFCGFRGVGLRTFSRVQV